MSCVFNSNRNAPQKRKSQTGFPFLFFTEYSAGIEGGAVLREQNALQYGTIGKGYPYKFIEKISNSLKKTVKYAII